MEYNPLLNWDDLPPFDRIETQHIEPGIRTLLEGCEQAVARLEETAPRTWRDLMDPLERIEDDLGRIWGIVSHLHGVKNSPELRDVYDPLLAEVVKFGNRLGQSKPLFQAYCALRDGEEARGFAPAQLRILESAIREAELNGVGLDDADRERYNQISQRLAELSTKFSNNVLDATKAFKVKLTEADEVAGLPDTLLELAADTARQEGHEEATASDGPWVLTLDYPSFMPFMQHSKRRDLRERMYRAFISKASDGQWDNKDVAREIIALRIDKCRLLGYDTFAALSLSRKMAPDAGSVRRLLDELRAAGRGAAEQDMEALKALAGLDGRTGLNGDDEGDELKHWDVPYWAERLREARFDLKDEELRPYFPLPRVLNGLFELTERLFGVRLEESIGEAPVWHEDVQFFRVFDDRGEPMAAFYLDPYSRPAEKQGGAWMDTLVGRSAVMASAGRTARLPVAYMICNQGKPVGGKPSLMTFREVETLFHEFGHALQHMLTTIDYGMASGISNVEWDAVEIASQFMENWCYDRGTLKGLARHYETDEPLPDKIIDRLLGARTFREGSNTLRQVNFGLLDMELHEHFDPSGAETILDMQRRIDAETLILPALEEDRFFCSFSHIFAGGYAAGYYSYKWSEVLSADAFSAFEEAGLENEAEIRRLGRRFRDTILALGGSRHPMEVFRDFRGREPTTDALLRQGGLLHE